MTSRSVFVQHQVPYLSTTVHHQYIPWLIKDFNLLNSLHLWQTLCLKFEVLVLQNSFKQVTLWSRGRLSNFVLNFSLYQIKNKLREGHSFPCPILHPCCTLPGLTYSASSALLLFSVYSLRAVPCRSVPFRAVPVSASRESRSAPRESRSAPRESRSVKVGQGRSRSVKVGQRRSTSVKVGQGRSRSVKVGQGRSKSAVRRRCVGGALVEAQFA